MARGIEECLAENTDPEIILENVSGFFYFQAITAKIITSIIVEKKFKYLYEEIMKDWKEIKDETEVAELHKFASIGRQLSIIYTVYVYSSAVMYIVLPATVPMILNAVMTRNVSFKPNLCIYAEYFVDEEKYFFYLFLDTLIAGCTTVIVTAAVDTTFVSCVQHVLGLFNIIKLANLIQTAYNECFFFIAVLLLFGISTFTVDLVMNLHSPLNFLRIGVLWLGTVIYMFYVNYPGQKLFDTSGALFESIYACGWYRFPAKTQTLVRFMMLRSTIPCRLTAGPLLDMNFESCSLILRSALSYFTVLASMN